jgi:thiol:disulfide interchange protein DsbA
MKLSRSALLTGLAILLTSGLASPVCAAARNWVEGRNYAVLNPAQHTTVPAGKVEVLEVFSYGCPFCNNFQPVVEKLKTSLPSNAQMVYLPASFNPPEAWPMFQRAYFAAQALGIADKTHQAMYDAVWKTGELAISDPVTHRLKKPLPSIEDAARCYGRLTGVKPEAFLAAARSFGVETKMRAADAQVNAMEIPSTPCIVVNGKYRVSMDNVASYDELVELVSYLVAKETPGRK